LNERNRGIRHRVTYRNDNLYVTIFPMRTEVFISSVDKNPDELTMAGLDTIARLVSLAWKTTTIDKVIGQMRKASRTDRDIPGILANLLAEDDFDDDDKICDDKTN